MTLLTRREFGKLSVAGMLFAPDSRVNGVHLGVQTYSFRDLPRPDADGTNVVIDAMRACGLVECELYAPQIEPLGTREEIRRFRVETPLDHFREVGQRFRKAGITVWAFCYNMARTFTDPELERGFEIAKALGAEIMTTSTTQEVAARVAPMADKHKMIVALHGHSKKEDPNEFATPDSFARGLKLSRYFRINLDIGHFTAAGFDAVPFIREHHAEIANLHIKDMLRNKPESYVPWGTGQTPIREVLQLLKRERWPIRTYVEYEYPSANSPVEEVKKCVSFAREALNA